MAAACAALCRSATATGEGTSWRAAKLHVPEGYAVTVAAAPPLVRHPTFACFDERGNLYVCDNAGLNLSAEELERKLPNRIVRLTDSNGDGVFDRGTVFADRMTFPMGGVWTDRSLFVASPPHIWRLTDVDGDGVADQRQPIVSRFGYTGNAASIHGCFKGPDGRIYWTDGFHGHEFRNAAGVSISQRSGSYLFSCRPDGSDVQIFCGGGMDNPVEVDFTPAGEMLGTVNILYSRPRVDCFVHWQFGGAYPHRARIRDEWTITGELLGPVHRFGHVAVSGTVRYRSGVLDRDWIGEFFVTFFNSGKVVRLRLSPTGSTFTALQREFLVPESPDFHPTDVLEDADGSLLIVDTGGWFYRGCPTSQFAKPDILGAIYRVARRRQPRLSDPRGDQIDWTHAGPARLIELLDDPRWAVRDRAVDECVRRIATQHDAELLPVLRQRFEQGSVRLRQNAVWIAARTLSATNTAGKQADPNAAALLRRALRDTQAAVRQAAARAALFLREPGLLASLRAALSDPSPAVRRNAAAALGNARDAQAVPLLLERIPLAVDREEEHALVFALIQIDRPAAVRSALGHSQPRLQRAALIALDQMDHGGLQASDVIPLLDADDRSLRAAAVDVWLRHPTWQQAARPVLLQWLSDTRRAMERRDALAPILQSLIHDPSVAERVGAALARSNPVSERHRMLLKAIAGASGAPMHASWKDPLIRDLHSTDPTVVEAAIAAAAVLRGNPLREQLQQLGAALELPRTLRVAALQAVGGSRSRLGTRLFTLLLEMLNDGTPAERSAAAATIGAATLDDAQLQSLLPVLREAGPSELRELIRPYRRVSRAELAREFLTELSRARSLTSLEPTQLSDVVKRFPREALPLANRVLTRLKTEQQRRIALLDELLVALPAGDPRRGQAVFFSEKARCSTCHRIAQRGGRIGPDLSHIGSNRSPADLLESIVFPSASIVRDYETYAVVLEDGRVLTGLIVRDDTRSITLQPAEGQPVELDRENIETVIPQTVSLMPSGFDKQLTRQELVDLVAFLSTCRQTSPALLHSANEPPGR